MVTEAERKYQRVYQKKWREDNKEKVSEQVRNRRIKNIDKYKERDRLVRASRQEKLDAYKLERGCLECGYNKCATALEFDHLPGFIKIRSIGEMMARNTAWKTIEKEITKCELVCANCHAERTSARRKI